MPLTYWKDHCSSEPDGMQLGYVLVNLLCLVCAQVAKQGGTMETMTMLEQERNSLLTRTAGELRGIVEQNRQPDPQRSFG